jgi:hypothetical protein
MIILKPSYDDLCLFNPEPNQAKDLPPHWREIYANFQGLITGMAFIDNEPVAIFGLSGWPTDYRNEAIGWAVLGNNSGPHLLALTRFIKKQLNIFNDVVFLIKRGWEQAERWARMFGFKSVETYPHDENYDVYERAV